RRHARPATAPRSHRADQRRELPAEGQAESRNQNSIQAGNPGITYGPGGSILLRRFRSKGGQFSVGVDTSSHASRILRIFFLSGSDMLLYLRKKASSSTSSSGVVANSVSRNSVVTSSAAAILPIFSADGFGSSLFSS